MAMAITPSSFGSRVSASPLLQLGAMPPPALSLSSGPSARCPFLPAPPASRFRFVRHACAAACAPYALAPSGRAPPTTGQASTGATPSLRAVPLRRPPPVRPVAIARSFRGKQGGEAKATENDQSAKKPQKVNSILCKDCEGNGAIVCTQCEGRGVNSVDHFNGRFKAGALCWLCRGKREILCGSCNGAGFLGGFLSSFDETAD